MAQTPTSPIILLGAARSGTKLLREIIAVSARTPAVPYDVNYLWRAAAPEWPDDALPAERMTRQHARRLTDRLGRAAGGEGVFIEKTVSNVLRIPYLLRGTPEARFVHLVRDGRDVIESAMRCWKAPPSTGYALRKALSFPWASCFSYGVRHVASSALRAAGRGPTPCWGPCYPGMREDAKRLTLAEVCAWQWRHCVEAYERDRDLIPPERRVEVRYESLVADPVRTLDRLMTDLDQPATAVAIKAASRRVAAGNSGRHRQLSAADRTAVDRIAGETLIRLGYLQPSATRSAA